jgi:hypothetical protein
VLANRASAIVAIAVAVALMPGAVGGAALPRSAGGDGQQFGQTIETDPAKPSPDDMERLTPRFQALLRETGALGTYPRPDGTVVVVVPASGSSRFTVQDAAALGIAVAIESRDNVGNFTGTQRKVSGAGDAGVSTQTASAALLHPRSADSI